MATPNEPTFFRTLGAIGADERVKLLAVTTNGLLLPRKLPKLVEYGVNRINISIDTLVEEKFEF